MTTSPRGNFRCWSVLASMAGLPSYTLRIFGQRLTDREQLEVEEIVELVVDAEGVEIGGDSAAPVLSRRCCGGMSWMFLLHFSVPAPPIGALRHTQRTRHSREHLGRRSIAG